MTKIDTQEAMPEWYNALVDFLCELKDLKDSRIKALLKKYNIKVTR